MLKNAETGELLLSLRYQLSSANVAGIPALLRTSFASMSLNISIFLSSSREDYNVTCVCLMSFPIMSS